MIDPPCHRQCDEGRQPKHVADGETHGAGCPNPRDRVARRKVPVERLPCTQGGYQEAEAKSRRRCNCVAIGQSALGSQSKRFVADGVQSLFASATKCPPTSAAQWPARLAACEACSGTWGGDWLKRNAADWPSPSTARSGAGSWPGVRLGASQRLSVILRDRQRAEAVFHGRSSGRRYFNRIVCSLMIA